MATNAGFFQTLREVRAALSSEASGDTAQRLKRIESLLEDRDVQREFFNLLASPEWIQPLQAAGYFAHPPSPKHTAGGVELVRWPASEFLARVAGVASDQVANVFSAMRTDNPAVVGDMINATKVMTVRAAASMVPALSEAAQVGLMWIGFDDASELCARLAKAGEVDAAVSLAHGLFDLRATTAHQQDEHWYKEGLRAAVPSLVQADAGRVIPMLVDWTRSAIGRRGSVDPDNDQSHVWRPAIEDHEQNQTFHFAGEMVGIFRDAVEQAIREGHLSLQEVLDLVEKTPGLVFRRVRLHLINVFADRDPELARHTMMDPELFDNHRVKHEYAKLVGARLPLLDSSQREVWFSRVDAGPDLRGFDARFTKDGRPPTEEDRQRRRDYWKYERLHWVKDHLDPARRAFYDSMHARHGEPELADLNIKIGGARWGDESPVTADQLEQMGFDRALEFVNTWRPGEGEDDDFIGPNASGLASAFQQYVSRHVEEHSREAERLAGCAPRIVHRFLDQMASAVRDGKPIDLRAVLSLCLRLVKAALPSEAAELSDVDLDARDPESEQRQWTRDTIADLVRRVCAAQGDGGARRYPVREYRETVWQIIEPLLDAPAKSYLLWSDDSHDVRTQDFLSISMNSPRGKALEAAIEYARWVAHHLKTGESGREVVVGGFNAMPEVSRALEAQLEPSNAAFESRGAIGMHAGLLHWIDPAWFSENAGRIFDLREHDMDPVTSGGWAAWNSFLVSTRPHIEMFRALRAQFQTAVTEAARVDTLKESGSFGPFEHLGQHLILLYGRGHLGLDDEDALLRRFLATGAPWVRRKAISFVGQSLEASRDARVPDEVIRRFMSLWDLYWGSVGQADARGEPTSHLFGQWFTCGLFPVEWSLERLEQFVAVVPKPHPDHEIVQQLAKVCEADSLRAVNILEKLARGDEERWRIGWWKDHAMTILAIAIKRGGEAQKVAERLVDYLGRRGFTDFGRLLVD